MTTRDKPAAPAPRLVGQRAEALEGGEPTSVEGHRRLIDTIADAVAIEAADRAIAKAGKKKTRRRPESD